MNLNKILMQQKVKFSTTYIMRGQKYKTREVKTNEQNF